MSGRNRRPSSGLLRVLSLAFCCSIALSASAQQPAPPPLRVLSWNIYMLPKFARITGKRQRAHHIVEQVGKGDYDIIVFQEAFLGDARRIIGRGLRREFPHQYGPANRKFSIKTNSGIWVLSRDSLHPIEEVDYVECDGFDDCFARKGAFLLSGSHHGTAFQILGTHLQAGGPQSVRHSQYVEMRQLLDRHREAGIPQLIVGDMNTGLQDTAKYRDMVTTLDAEDGPLTIQLDSVATGYPNDLHSNGIRSFRIIDFAFYRANGRPPASIHRFMPRLAAEWSKKHRDLSDHFPVVLEVGW